MKILSFLNDLVVALTYPPMLSLGLLACGAVAAAIGWRKSGKALVVAACAWSVLWSIPQCAHWLRAPLERQYVALEAAALRRADAIVVLGGGSYAWLQRPEVQIDDLEHSRVAAGARAWLAGRAPVVMLSSGSNAGKGRSEADIMAAAIERLGVPDSALILEDRSRDTHDNALFSAKLAERQDIHRVLLVTSSLHMPRATYWYRQYGLDVIPAPVPEARIRGSWTQRWLPSRAALWRSGRAWKEYAGLLAAHVQTKFQGRTGRSGEATAK